MRELLLALNDNMLAAASRGREVRDVGPFRAMITADTDFVWANFAVPTRDGFTRKEVDLLTGHFQAKKRLPRLEILQELWPDLPPILEAAGYICEHDLPLMVCTEESFRPSPGMDRTEILAADGDLAAAWIVETAAFGHPEPPDETRLDRRRARIRTANLAVALARFESMPAASALLMMEGAVAELAGVATLPEYRRRGLASDVSSCLLTSFFESGGKVVWLSAADEAAWKTYSKLGFSRIGSQVNYIKSP
jgi:ribosomal protein S18 acetylase RimI-like enzyme